MKPMPLRDRLTGYMATMGRDACWPWEGCLSTSNALPQGNSGGRRVIVYRFAHEMFIGPLRRYAVQRRECATPTCVNPYHYGLTPTVPEFMAANAHRPNECWVWTASVPPKANGYGRTGSSRQSGQTRYAHRVAWEHVNGPVPDGLELDHLCRNRRCVNPRHLEPVTHAENVRRGNAPNAPYMRGERLRASPRTPCSAGPKGARIQGPHRRVGRPYAEACKHGHALHGDNLYVAPKTGRRNCRECARERRKRSAA